MIQTATTKAWQWPNHETQRTHYFMHQLQKSDDKHDTQRRRTAGRIPFLVITERISQFSFFLIFRANEGKQYLHFFLP